MMMNTLLLRYFFWLLMLTLSVSPCHAEDTLLFSEAPFTIPDATLALQQTGGPPPRELKFVREYFIDETQLASIRRMARKNGHRKITAEDAKKICKADVEAKSTVRDFAMSKIELVWKRDDDKPPIAFYHVCMLVNGSEENRIVLMNRDLLEPTLRHIKE